MFVSKQFEKYFYNLFVYCLINYFLCNFEALYIVPIFRLKVKTSTRMPSVLWKKEARCAIETKSRTQKHAGHFPTFVVSQVGIIILISKLKYSIDYYNAVFESRKPQLKKSNSNINLLEFIFLILYLICSHCLFVHLFVCLFVSKKTKKMFLHRSKIALANATIRPKRKT